MAKKRLNKKIAIIGSVVFVFLGLVAIGIILYLSRDPQKFIKDGDQAYQAAERETDPNSRLEQYNIASKSYLRARARTKSDSLRIEILFKLIDVYLKTDQWNNILGCWNNIIQIDPKNVKARFGRLKYLYIFVDSIAEQGLRGGPWKEITTQTTDFIDNIDSSVLPDDVSKWDSFALEEKSPAKKIGSYLYLLRGRANLEVANMGGVTNPDDLLAKSTEDLEKVKELEPENIDARWYLAQTIIAKGELLASRGQVKEKDQARQQAVEILKQAVKVAGANPRAHINLLRMETEIVHSGDTASAQKQIQSLEPKYLALVDKFKSSPEAFSMLTDFYQRLGHKKLDKAIQAIEKAIELDGNNVNYAITSANLYYRKFSIGSMQGEKQTAYFDKAVDTARNALDLPDAQDKPGPRNYANKRNKTILYEFMANCFIERVFESMAKSAVSAQSQDKTWLEQAEQAVHEIEQLAGSGEDTRVVKWEGMLELARGNNDAAIKKLYTIYEQLKAAGSNDSQISYALARGYKNSSEVGAASEFMMSALKAGVAVDKPEAFLDYADLALKQQAYNDVLSAANVFEQNLWPSERARILRINAYIGAKQFDEAEQELAKANPDDPNIIRLNLSMTQAKMSKVLYSLVEKRLKDDSNELPHSEKTLESQPMNVVMTDELKGYNDTISKLLEKLLKVDPNSISTAAISQICSNYIREGNVEKARSTISGILKYSPQNTTALFYKRLLSEPDPNNVSPEKSKEIEMTVLMSIDNPVRKSMGLGSFYLKNGEPNEAAAEFKKIFNLPLPDKQNAAEKKRYNETMEAQRFAAIYLSEVALRNKDVELAEQILSTAQRNNLDGCKGKFFAAFVPVIKEDYKSALEALDECLKESPVFSLAYILRGKVNAALGNESASIADMQKAVSFNPLSGDIAKDYALALHRRNEKLGNNITPKQVTETKTAIMMAIRLNSEQISMPLQGLYADYVGKDNQEDALAIRDRLQKVSPSVENAFMLGKMAMQMALRETTPSKKQFYYNKASSAFEQALAYDPNSKLILDNYAEYFRVTGQNKKAEELLEKSKDKRLLWLYYYRDGKFEEAGKVLNELYKTNPKDPTAIRGLAFLAEKNADQKSIKKYSEELLSVEDTIDNRLYQIQTFLNVGLLKEAENKLQSFRDKYPDEKRALYLEANLATRQGQMQKALDMTNRILETNQDNPSVWQLRGNINFFMGKYDQAILDLNKSKSLLDDPGTRLLLAKAYLQNGLEEYAVTELKNAIDNPQTPRENRLLLEQIYSRSGKKEELAKFYKTTLEKFPDDVFWLNRIAGFALFQKDFEGSEKLYTKSLEISKAKNLPGTGETLNGYLQAILASGKLDKLFEQAGKYIDGDFASVAFINMAQAKLKLGDKTTAIQYCRKAVDKAASDENLGSWVLQRMYYLIGPDEVSTYCNEKLQADPQSLVANNTMFNLAKIKQEYNKAVEYIDKCIQIVESDSPKKINYTIEKVTILQLLYIKTSDKNYLDKAIKEYESLLEKMPNNTDVLNNLAYLLAENNEKLDKALQYIESVHDLMPNNAGVLDTYGYVLYKNGKYAQAEESLEAAIQQYEQAKASVPSEVYEHLGMTKEKLGNKVQSLNAYKQALEAGGDKLPQNIADRIKSAVERLSK
ncbi:MAG: tetratricopeptide repeat protein [Planctomycetota bacterium]|nr:tetratricopeptide repeat protein [Planctomycetota bacterium]